ncbi:MAG: NAD(P)-binding domain-containing protein [Gemmatimonadaceae bacterium]|nr:NAD(P)-binding domain-containing protein [Gemmatimonadaceae bacterium]
MTRIGVIGAGSSGLAAAKNLLQSGFDVEVLEREDDLGGNWNYGKPYARVYRSTHTISSKPGTEYCDYPMPAAFPDYPHHSQILAYLRSYAEAFDVLPRIRFSTAAEQVEPVTAGAPDTAWRVRTADGTTREYDALVVANGHNWSPKTPTYPGTFTGTVMHSAHYRTPDVFLGKRVLVVGGGNSGCDIIVEAAQFGDRAWHSTRRGYYYFPKYVLGRPADQFGDTLHALRVPLWIRRAIASVIYRVFVGSPKSLGLPIPDHRLFETHPVVNTLLPYYVGQGDITPVGDIARFDGATVHFTDGRSSEFDLIVFATGFNIEFPFLDRAHLNWQNGRPALHQNVFHPEYDTLFVAGLIQPDSGQFGLVHRQTAAIASFLAARRDKRASAAAFRAEKRRADPGSAGGVHYKDSTRHYVEVEHWSYGKGLERTARQLAR